MKEHYIVHSIACFEGPTTNTCVLAVILWGHDPKTHKTDISVYGGEGVKLNGPSLEIFDPKPAI